MGLIRPRVQEIDGGCEGRSNAPLGELWTSQSNTGRGWAERRARTQPLSRHFLRTKPGQIGNDVHKDHCNSHAGITTPGQRARAVFVQGSSLMGTFLLLYKSFPFGTGFYFQNPDPSVQMDSEIACAKEILRDRLVPHCHFFLAKITKAQRGLMNSPRSHDLFGVRPRLEAWLPDSQSRALSQSLFSPRLLKTYRFCTFFAQVLLVKSIY